MMAWLVPGDAAGGGCGVNVTAAARESERLKAEDHHEDHHTRMKGAPTLRLARAIAAECGPADAHPD